MAADEKDRFIQYLVDKVNMFVSVRNLGHSKF